MEEAELYKIKRGKEIILSENGEEKITFIRNDKLNCIDSSISRVEKEIDTFKPLFEDVDVINKLKAKPITQKKLIDFFLGIENRLKRCEEELDIESKEED